MDATSTNVAHLVEIPSENSLMYQKFNSVAAKTFCSTDIPAYITNDTSIVHCYDALCNRILRTKDMTYYYHDDKSIIWNDLVGTNDLVLTSDNIYFTSNSVCLSKRSNGLILSDMSYNMLMNEAYAKYGTNVLITIEVCFKSDDYNNFILYQSDPDSYQVTYPNRHTIFNMGYRQDSSERLSQPAYFTLNNDVDPDNYLNYNNKPLTAFAATSGYNEYYSGGSIDYREIVSQFFPFNSSSTEYEATTNKDDFIYMFNKQLDAGRFGDRTDVLPPITYSISFSPGMSLSTSLSNENIDEIRYRSSGTKYMAHHGSSKMLEYFQGIGYSYPIIYTWNEGYLVSNTTNILYSISKDSWSYDQLKARYSIQSDESYCSFGGLYTKSRINNNKYIITENELFYGDIYSIRIYIDKPPKSEDDRLMTQALVDRNRFFSHLDR